MMLSLSADTTETAIDLQMVNGSSANDAQEMPYANELASFAGAVAERNTQKILQTRDQLVEIAGEAVMIDAAAVAANFQRMVRIADSMGIPIDEKNVVPGAAIREALNLSRFASAQNTPVDDR